MRLYTVYSSSIPVPPSMPSMIMFHAVGPEKASPANRFFFPFDLLVTSRPKVVSAGTGDGPMVRCDSPPCNRLLS